MAIIHFSILTAFYSTIHRCKFYRDTTHSYNCNIWSTIISLYCTDGKYHTVYSHLVLCLSACQNWKKNMSTNWQCFTWSSWYIYWSCFSAAWLEMGTRFSHQYGIYYDIQHHLWLNSWSCCLAVCAINCQKTSGTFGNSNLLDWLFNMCYCCTYYYKYDEFTLCGISILWCLLTSVIFSKLVAYNWNKRVNSRANKPKI